MNRLARKHRTEEELGIIYDGSITDYVDNELKRMLRLNDAEFDYVIECMTDEEMSLIVKDTNFTFTEKRQLLLVVENYLLAYKINKLL